MPTVLVTANERVLANERFWEVSENLSLALNVSSAEGFFFIGKCFIGEKYELPGDRGAGAQKWKWPALQRTCRKCCFKSVQSDVCTYSSVGIRALGNDKLLSIVRTRGIWTDFISCRDFNRGVTDHDRWWLGFHMQGAKCAFWKISLLFSRLFFWISQKRTVLVSPRWFCLAWRFTRVLCC